MKDLSRRHFLSSVSLGTMGGLLGQSTQSFSTAIHESRKQSAPSHAARPNLVLFMPDELRADALGCYGNSVVKTPNFDRLAKEGTRFSECHVAYPICGASRCSMLTGWPTSVRGHRSQQFFLRRDEPNLFRYLRDGGYDVFWFGKNDVFAAETFEDSVTAWNHSVPSAASGTTNRARAGALPVEYVVPFLNATKSQSDPRSSGDFLHVQAAISILQRTQQDRPFCIFLPLLSPHPPYNAPGRFDKMYSPDDIGPLLPTNLPRRPDYMQQMRRAYGMTNTSSYDLGKVRAAYLGKVSYTDWLLGELLEALDRTNHTRDTALMVLSDHGDYAGDYGLVEKWPSGMEDCMTHVPLIGRIPGGKAGHVVAEQIELFDVMATCLDLASIEARHTHFARSLVPQFNGAPGDPNRASFTEGGYNTYEPQCFEPVPPKGTEYYPRIKLHHSEPQTVSRCASIKTAKYHFVSRPFGQSEFYVLENDPMQKENRYGESSVQTLQLDAERRLLHWYVNTTGISPYGADSRDFPPYIPLDSFSGEPPIEQQVDLD